MSPKERIIAIRLAERIKQNPEYAKRIGVLLTFQKVDIRKNGDNCSNERYKINNREKITRFYKEK